MIVHSVLSGFIAGFGYENGVLRVVLKSKSGLKAYDYYGVSAEDAGTFTQELGKAYNSLIKPKYSHTETAVTDLQYYSLE